MSRFLASILALSLLPALAHSQHDTTTGSSSAYWLTLGLGGTFGNKDLSVFGGTVGVSHLSDVGLLTIRLSGVGRLGEESMATTAYVESVTELSGLYGISYHPRFIFLSASAGLGVVRINENGLTGRSSSTTIGLLLEAQVFITPLPVLGAGLNVFWNVNSLASYGGMFLCLQFGKLW